MGFYERFVLPVLIDVACGNRQVAHQRSLVVPEAEGVVVEVGAGSGRNLPFYRRERVRRLIAVDPSAPLLHKAQARARRLGLDVDWREGVGEELPVADGEADTVVITYTLCTVADPAATLAEARRVLRPGGRLLFVEHGAAPDEAVRRWQERLDRLVWPKIAGGCHLARRPDAALEAAGFRFDRLEMGYLPKTPRSLGFNYWGAASPA
ncbi:MAG: class I SAM-dependent methyltransferase [Alphaproteobacteria bacterium]|nr:MAG: class I SAM-dependent methyltransferase [Alphaproteobacteria bacterium]